MAFNITPAAALSDVVYGINLLTNSLSSDVVGIFDSNSFQQVFAQARPMRAQIRETSKVMDHPAETGVVLSDHHIINPTEIDMQMIIPAQYFSSTYVQIRTAWTNATKLNVQTKTGTYRNMVIQDMPHEEDPDKFDVISLFLRFKEIIYQVPTAVAGQNMPANYSPINPLNSNTAQNGLQSALGLGTQALTTASGVMSYANVLKFL